MTEPRDPGTRETWLARVLEPPRYGWTRDGALYVPSVRESWAEFFHHVNPLVTRKNWVAAFSWFTTLVLAVPAVVYVAVYWSWPITAFGVVYSMVALGTHGTVWYHRYGSHQAYKFRNGFTRFIVRNLVIKLVVEEAYIVSHRVHHTLAEKPGDPYNATAGFLYCFLADANHQMIARDLDEKRYAQVARLVTHTGVKANTYAQYQRWGSIAHPARTVAHFAGNWAFWYAAFWLIGGHALATGVFAWSMMWAVGVRTYNFEGHGKGRDQRVDGVDFHRGDRSVNQMWPGYVAGEWHNNHHLYQNGARSGFLPYQLDLAWLFIRGYAAIGGITSWVDPKPQFMRDHYEPWLAAQRARETASRAADA